MNKIKILVTGGAGFIGSAFVRYVVKKGYAVAVVDKLTYAGDLQRLKEVSGKYKFYKADICDRERINNILKKEKPHFLVHSAAETHVDRSIRSARYFIETNIKGTHLLLEASRKYKIKRFLQISTDECYGDIKEGRFSEDAPLRPSSPYAASKAAADLLIKAYIRTYNFPAIIIRPSNNYGPWQYPEKFIPLAILRILQNKKIPVYGTGKNVREWLYVEDCAEGIAQVLQKGKIGEVYNLGSNQEMQNREIARAVLEVFKKDDVLIGYVKDRPGHDFRYSLNSKKIYKDIGWRPKISFRKGLERTVRWCMGHKDWMYHYGKSVSRMYDNVSYKYGF